MTLPVATYRSPLGTTTLIPQPPSNISSYNILFGYINDDDKTLQETSFFDNANELEVENVQQLVASTLFSNQLSRPSNLRVTTPSVRNTNSESSLENPYNFLKQLNIQPVNNRWLESNSSNRGNNTIGHQNVTTKGTPQSITPILTPQLAIIPVGGNNDNAYLQVIQGLAE
ncbi:2170_t:CDS:2 [Funneliformis caledonium]|uniref:2170_t:CDS:1 n=1 Tax=Funneliformis caledonium TaxID=1117310 RepID=A0A9N8YNU3_9GLOM|nr:2170_t:CDS:2 [Funneliformis caledonium]